MSSSLTGKDNMCPLCGYKYVCPCDSCNNRTPKAEDVTLPRWPWDKDGMQNCPVCGLYLSLDHWQDIQHDECKRINKIESKD